MGLFSRWFGKKPEDYEQILASLSSDIQKRQTRLNEIRLRERRATLLFSVYALSLWVAYVSVWYMDLLPNLGGGGGGRGIAGRRHERVGKAIPVFLGPIVILFIRRIVQIWYTRIGNAEEKQLVSLRKQQREKIEEIKKQTNYYTTRNLLERYDETSAPSPQTPMRRGPGGMMVPPQTPMSVPRVPVTPQRPIQQQQGGVGGKPQPGLLQTPAGPLSPGLQQHLSPSPQRPLPPPRKQWYDRLADAILGDDDSGSTNGPAASRYALICQKCFAHNGLVKESIWEDTQYVCPKCGHFNPSARALREAKKQGSKPDFGDRNRSSTSPSPTRAPGSGQNGNFAPPIGEQEPLRTPVATIRNRRNRSRDDRDGEGEADGGEDVSVMDVDS